MTVDSEVLKTRYNDHFRTSEKNFERYLLYRGLKVILVVGCTICQWPLNIQKSF